MTLPSGISTFFSSTLPQWWSPSGFLKATPPATWPLKWEYVGLIGICLLVGIVTAFLKIRPSLKSRILSFAWTNALLGALLFFFRDQRIPYLGADVLRLLQEIGIVFWINSIVWFARNGLQAEKVAEQVALRKEKYLPKAKK